MHHTPLQPSADQRHDIEELLARAAYALDERKDAMLASCFTVDARFTLRIGDGDLVGPFEGRDAIMGLMRGSWETQTDKRRHIISNVFYPEADGDRCRVISYLTLVATEEGAIQVLTAGLYEDEVVYTECGWQLAKRHIDLDKSY